MPDPNFTFAAIIATLCGAIGHLVVGGGARRLTLFILAGWLGFGAGNLLGHSLEIRLFRVGDLNLFTALGGVLFALFLAHIFSSGRPQRPARK